MKTKKKKEKEKGGSARFDSTYTKRKAEGYVLNIYCDLHTILMLNVLYLIIMKCLCT